FSFLWGFCFSFLFSHAFTAVPLTLPAHASIMTGLYPLSHGVRNNGSYRLDDTVPTIASILSDVGYRTKAVVSAFVLDSQFGLDSGFQSYDDHLEYRPDEQPTSSSLERKGDAVTDAAISFIDEAESSPSPYFLWVHYFDPHHPYKPPPQYGRMYPWNPYAGEIAYMDECVGRLLGRLEEGGGDRATLTVIVGDHGEDLGDHGEMSHGTFLYESTIRIPLIISFPGRLPEGVKVDEPVSVVDVFSTVIDILGIESDTLHLQGQSLLGSIQAEAARQRPIYFETRYPLESMGWSPLEGIIMGDWKYIRAPLDELYDLRDDPREITNLLEGESERVARMSIVLDSLKQEFAEGTKSATFAADRETLDKLAALGYVTGPAMSDQGHRDPKDMVPVFARKAQGVNYYESGEYESAEKAFREALESDPSNVLLINYRALSLYQMGKMEEAVELWKTALEISPSYLDIYLNMGMAYLAMGKPDMAKWAYEKVLEMNPDYVKAILGVGKAHLMAGEIESAVSMFEEAVAADPGNPSPRLLLGLSLKAKGELEGALREIEQALLIKPDMKKAKREKAMVLIQLNRPRPAIEVLEELVAGDPYSPILMLDLGNALEMSGMLDEALVSYRRAAELDSTSFRAYNNIGAILDRMGKEAESERALRKALSLNANFPEAYYNLGLLYAELGKKDEARWAFERFLSLWKHQDETRRRAQKALEELRRSD
ncbi:MAG: tetratricopeptide repeat protein, partial [Candidatus Glassbacteria bacterium]